MSNLADLIINEEENVIISTLSADQQILEQVNIIDRFGFCGLIQAVICKKNKVLKYLLKHGAKVDQVDILGRTALQWAVERGVIESCKILLAAGADPNHYSLDGQPIMVYPILRGNLQLVELLKQFKANHLFAQDFISAKLIGHRFELTGEADIVSPKGSFVPLMFEGFYLEFTAGLIARSLHDFINSIPGQEFSDQRSKLSFILEALKNAAILESFSQHKDKSLFQPQIRKILQQNLVLLPSAYSGHAITFIKYKNYLAKCDRGVSNITDTVIIYEIGNNYLCNEELFLKILYEPKTDDFVNFEIKQYLSLTPVKSLPTRSQIAGNCSFANVETSVPAMLYLLLDPKEPQQAAAIEKQVYKFYKSWLEWDKDTALAEAISDLHNAESPRQLSKAMILGAILVQRLQASSKKHVERAKKIIKILLQPNFQFILRNYITVYRKSVTGTIGNNFMALLEVCGISPQDFNAILLPSNTNVKLKTVDPADINLVKMSTALHVACWKNNINTVKYLLERAKMDVNYLDRTGSTALMYAAWQGHFPLVKLLIQAGADPCIKNYKNGTAEKYARHAGLKKIAEFLKMQCKR